MYITEDMRVVVERAVKCVLCAMNLRPSPFLYFQIAKTEQSCLLSGTINLTAPLQSPGPSKQQQMETQSGVPQECMV